MKKLFVIAMLATVGMAACSKDDTAPAGGPKKYVQVTIPEKAVADNGEGVPAGFRGDPYFHRRHHDQLGGR